MDHLQPPLLTTRLQITQLRVIATATGPTIRHGMIPPTLTGTTLLRIVQLAPEIIIATVILGTIPQHEAPTDTAGE